MKLSAFVIDGHAVDIRPAPVERDWMDASRDRFAYRCLPLNIANAHGWEILCSSGFTAAWDGSDEISGVAVAPDTGTVAPAVSHFGGGVLTFHVPCLFQTEPGHDLMVLGPINRPKDAIAALSGVIETDWSPYTFTMNWIFTRQDTPVRFEKGEPICHMFPVKRGELEEIEPELGALSDNPALKAQHEAWSQGRRGFNAALKQPGSEAQAERWQKLYYRGLGPGGDTSGPDDHRTRLRLKPFTKRT